MAHRGGASFAQGLRKLPRKPWRVPVFEIIAQAGAAQGSRKVRASSLASGFERPYDVQGYLDILKTSKDITSALTTSKGFSWLFMANLF